MEEALWCLRSEGLRCLRGMAVLGDDVVVSGSEIFGVSEGMVVLEACSAVVRSSGVPEGNGRARR